MHAEPAARLAIGLTRKLSADELRRAAETGEIKNYLNWIEVRQGQVFFVPPGTLHTIGPGLILCEIQQNSDLTYRFYDFGRLGVDGKPRALHIERAVGRHPPRSLIPDRKSPFAFRPQALPTTSGAENCSWPARIFAVERIVYVKPVSCIADPERAHLLLFTAGEGRLTASASPGEGSAGGAGDSTEDHAYQAADAYLIPADAGPLTLIPSSATTMIRSYLPDLADLQKQLDEAGAAAHQIRRLILSS